MKSLSAYICMVVCNRFLQKKLKAKKALGAYLQMTNHPWSMTDDMIHDPYPYIMTELEKAARGACWHFFQNWGHFGWEITHICRDQRFVWWFEVNIEEWGLKSVFEGRHEAQKLDLRLKMRYNCRFWRSFSMQLWGHFTPNKSLRSDIFVLFPALYHDTRLVGHHDPWVLTNHQCPMTLLCMSLVPVDIRWVLSERCAFAARN